MRYNFQNDHLNLGTVRKRSKVKLKTFVCVNDNKGIKVINA